jgi:hypothetical protein
MVRIKPESVLQLLAVEPSELSRLHSIAQKWIKWLVSNTFLNYRHRPMYSSSDGVFNVDENFVEEVESLLSENKVSPFGLTSYLFFDYETYVLFPCLTWCELALFGCY